LVQYEQLPKCAEFARIGQPELERECVLAGGDDYELVFTAPRTERSVLEALAGELSLPLTRVGAIRAGAPSLSIVDSRGNEVTVRRGFDHFAP
jgi:thiamine-monophosphate kinase